MALLRYFPTQGPPVLSPLTKALTTLGRALDNDIRVDAPDVADHHLQIVFTGRDFQVETVAGAGLEVNGRRKKRSRLVHADRLLAGEAEFSFSMFGEVAEALSGPAGERGATEVTGLRKLQGFSNRLMTLTSVDELLEMLLDEVIEYTGAARGVVLWMDPADPTSAPKIRAARNVRAGDIEDAAGKISDSIVKEVLESKRPIIVSDALTDTVFGKSESVLALKLSSVMCAPLLSHGEVMGALYVGNDQVKSLFDRSQLDVLTVFASQAALILRNALLLSALRADKEKLEQELVDKRFGEIIGSCASMNVVFRTLSKVAPIDVSVLVTGETGTGKELIAREIHRRSERATGPFIAVNCGAIPENLIESELFGHVRGAFTGAVSNRPGKFQLANGGTLFLDELGELPVALQVKLLRALQEKVVIRVGDSRPETCDIRIVAATNRDLDAMIREGTFREDLFYRVNVVNLPLPPLRDRGEDCLIIAKVLLSKYADEMNSSVHGYSPSALSALRKHDWPGNIRELENRIKRALVLAEGSLLEAADLGLGEAATSQILPLERAKEEFQRRYVLEVLERNNGNRTQTARDLGVDPRTVFRYLENESPRTTGPNGAN